MTKTAKHLFSLLAAGSFLFLAVASTDDKKTEKEIATQEVSQPAIPVSATQLYSDYEANEVAADLKYKDKILLVSGTIDNIGKGLGDDIYVSLSGGEMAMDVQCFLSQDHVNEAAQLKKGQQVTIKGRCEGNMMNVMMRGCSMQ